MFVWDKVTRIGYILLNREASEHQARNFVDEENARCAEMTALGIGMKSGIQKKC